MQELQLLLGLFLALSSVDSFENTSLPCTGERSIRSVPRYYRTPEQDLRRYRPSYYRPNKQRNNSKRKQEKFAQDSLEAHNKKRRTSPHYRTRLVLDDKLYRGAQRYAENPTYQSKPKATYQSKPKPTYQSKLSSSYNSGSSVSFSAFAQEGLRLHNEKRKSRPHYGTELVLDEELTKGAQEYAELLARRDRGLQHYGGLGRENLGENLYAGRGRVGIERAVKVWFDEKDNGKHCMSHYSQLVWKGSKRFGVAQAKSRRGRIFIVARYSPAGNIWGAKYYRENVHPSFVYPC